MPITFDNLPIHQVERIIQYNFPIGFNKRLLRLKRIISADDKKDMSIEYHRKYIKKFIIGYDE